MSLRTKAIKGSAVLMSGEALIYGLSFVRNMILARALTKTDFGIAATFAMVITLLEFSAKMGIGRLVIRDPEGDRQEFVATAHFIQFCAACLSCVLILGAAWPLALAFDLTSHLGAFFVLAALPLLQGLVHLDPKRFERELRFGPSAIVDVVPQIVITLLAWPLALWLRNYWVILILLLLKALMNCLASHWQAEHPYRWRVSRDYARRMLMFGWPLVLNGFMMFAFLRGDQFIVASFYPMAELGAYAAAASLTLAPTLFFTRIFGSVMLPTMAKVQDDPSRFSERYGLTISVVAAFSVAYAVAVIVGAESWMQLAFGQKYQGAGVILGWLTASNSFRNLRLAPGVAAIAKGDTINQMVSNLAGGIALVPALTFAFLGKPIWMIAGSGLVGEVFACAVSFWRLKRRDGVTLVWSVIPVLVVLVAVSLAGWAAWLLHEQNIHPLWRSAAALAGGVFSGATVILVLSAARAEAMRLYQSTNWKKWVSPGKQPDIAKNPMVS